MGAAPAQADVYGCPTSYVCVHPKAGLKEAPQIISGYNRFTDLKAGIHDRASSWANANRSTHEGIGEWQNGKQYLGQVLPPGWWEENLASVNFNDRADWVKQV